MICDINNETKYRGLVIKPKLYSRKFVVHYEHISMADVSSSDFEGQKIISRAVFLRRKFFSRYKFYQNAQRVI